jgi:AcrR family transcriptional regulator
VDALLEAAARVLVEDGYEGATTKRVAEVAGVSIGSLYQYFPSKEALVGGLCERLAERVTLLCEGLRARRGEPLERAVPDLVRGMVAVYAANPRLQRVLVEQLPRLEGLEVLRDAEARMESIIRGELAQLREGLRPQNVELAVFVLLRAVRSVTWSAVLERPELLEDPALVEELSALVLGYLLPR